MKRVSLVGILLAVLMVLMVAMPVFAWRGDEGGAVNVAANPNGTNFTCGECGGALQCAWLSSQYMQPGFYGWDLSVPGGKMWGVCKCGNGK